MYILYVSTSMPQEIRVGALDFLSDTKAVLRLTITIQNVLGHSASFK